LGKVKKCPPRKGEGSDSNYYVCEYVLLTGMEKKKKKVREKKREKRKRKGKGKREKRKEKREKRKKVARGIARYLLLM